MPKTPTYFYCKGEESSITQSAVARSPLQWGQRWAFKAAGTAPAGPALLALVGAERKGLLALLPAGSRAGTLTQDRVQHSREQCPLAVPCSQGSQRVTVHTEPHTRNKHWAAACTERSITPAPVSSWSAASAQVAKSCFVSSSTARVGTSS